MLVEVHSHLLLRGLQDIHHQVPEDIKQKEIQSKRFRIVTIVMIVYSGSAFYICLADGIVAKFVPLPLQVEGST